MLQIRTGDTTPGNIKQQIVAALKQLSDELKSEALVTVDIERSRVQMLPSRR